MPSVEFLLPTLNEEKGIAATLEDIHTAGRRFHTAGWHVFVTIVDGNSKDRTQEIARAQGAKVLVEPRKGYGRAYKTGFAKAQGDYIVTGDADGTYPFEDAFDLVMEAINRKLDFVTTDRFANLDKGAMTLQHRFGNRVLSAITRILFGVRVRDSQSGMWVIHREALERLGKPLEAFADGMPFSEELKIEMFRRLKAKEVPGRLKARRGEKKLESWRDGLRNLLYLVRFRFQAR